MAMYAGILRLTLVTGYTSIALFGASNPAIATLPQEQVLYGDDHRLDVFNPENAPKMQELARSTALIVPKRDLNSRNFKSDADQLELRVRSYGRTYQLCEEERFQEQAIGGFCSSFLVAPNIMVTAGHCIASLSDCATSAFVFDYAYLTEDDTPSHISRRNVYYCSEIINLTLDPDNGNDFAVIRLDRDVEDRLPLDVRRSEKVPNAHDLTVIGNPSGLPTKIAAGAQVRHNTQPNFFLANLDTYEGNSGSAVFSSKSGMVEGILVRGEDDFEVDPARSCRRSKHCSDQECRGETVIRTTEFAQFLPQ